MATFLFWNINGKPLGDNIFRLVTQHSVDVLMLAECSLTNVAVLNTLNRAGDHWEFAAPVVDVGRVRIQLYTRLGQWHIREVNALPHSTIREMKLPNLPSLLLGAVHLPSKLWNDSNDQTETCRQLSVQLRDAETIVGHRRLLVTGDFNVNPFEPGMIALTALNAESSRHVAQQRPRSLRRISYPYFYNPMWSHLGDAGSGPGGTYFYEGTRRERISWNMFDQVLLRPSLLPYFQAEELEILTGDGANNFLDSKGVPDKARFSDHLPLLFKLNPQSAG